MLIIKSGVGKKKWIALDKRAFTKVLSIDRFLKFFNVVPTASFSTDEIYFDTSKNLIGKAGIILSKVFDKKSVYFKVQKMAYLENTLRSLDETIFVHDVGPKDSLMDHALYIADGIQSLISQNLSIDLENVLKQCFPKMEIKSKVSEYRAISGTGFRCKIYCSETKYLNFESRREFPNYEISVELEGPIENYIDEFNSFVASLEKYCKDMVPIRESTYDYARRVTKEIPVLTKAQKKALKDKLKGKTERDDGEIEG